MPAVSPSIVMRPKLTLSIQTSQTSCFTAYKPLAQALTLRTQLPRKCPRLVVVPKGLQLSCDVGGEGATAREALRHRSVEKVVMVDIDEVVTSFCRQHLDANRAAFADPRLELMHDDARAALERHDGTFDVIIGDLADPVEGGPCYQVPLQRSIRSHRLMSVCCG